MVQERKECALIDLFFPWQGTPTGSIESVPGFEPTFKAKVNFGADWLSFDPDGKHARVDVRGMARSVMLCSCPLQPEKKMKNEKKIKE